MPEPPDRPAGDAGADAAVAVVVEPEADPAAAPQVLRVKVQLPPGSTESADGLALYQGELDSYHLRRIQKQDLPKTLLDRRVPGMAWAEADGGTLVLAPVVPLDPGGTYSLASPSLGLVVTLGIRDGGLPPLVPRSWPPPDAGSGARHAVYCADGGVFVEAGPVELSPGHVAARVVPGIGASHAAGGACVALLSDALPDGGPALPPPRVGGVALDPAPLESADAPPPEPASCGVGEARFGPGCAEVEDDRVIVRAPGAPLFWAVQTQGQLTLDAADPGARFVVRGLSPGTTQRVDLSTIDLGGREQQSGFQLSTFSARAHVVVNEVMANPLGPEPTEEWVELANDGSVGVDLAGWVLSDLGGTTLLPSHMLPPGGFVLIVRDDYVADDGLDVPPAPGVPLIRVAALGSHGLSNAGEPLQLVDPSGHTASSFPVVVKPKAGISVARRHPWSLDDDPRAFGLSGGKGASPGAPNELLP